MNKLQSLATIDNGKLKLREQEKFTEALKVMPEGEYILLLKKLYTNRTNPQNAYYWGVVIPHVLEGLKELGHECETNDEAHEIVKKLFLKPKGKRKRLVNKMTGEYIYIVPERSTAKLTNIELAELIDKVIMWASEFLNIEIPLP